MNNSQLLKGILEGCVLLIISQEKVYGYELVQKLKAMGFVDIIGGTVYPLLQKLEKKDQLKSEMIPSPDGPDRKYYSLTETGQVMAETFKSEWAQLKITVDHIMLKTGGARDEEK